MYITNLVGKESYSDQSDHLNDRQSQHDLSILEDSLGSEEKVGRY